jgi:hypothetical protein
MSETADQASPGWALMTVNLDAATRTLAGAAAALGVPESAMDASFGVVPLDPERGLYAVQVRPDALAAHDKSEFRGPYADPRIEPF